MSLPRGRHHVFVYGTLRPGGYYHRRLVEGHPVQVTPAWVRGQLYVLAPGYPGLRPGNRRVQGEVLSFDDDGLLARLDALEGYAPEAPEAPEGEYLRKPCPAFGPDGSLLGEVWAYWIRPERLEEYRGEPVDAWDHRTGY